MQIDLREFLHFAVIAEEGSITAAARRLAIAQPWLSQRLKALEQRLGFDLFKRQGRGICLTPEGERIQALAQRLISIEGLLMAEAQEINAALTSRLRIGAPPYSRRVEAVGDILEVLGHQQPGLAIEMEVGWSPHLIERVRTGELDAAFVTEPFDPAGLSVQFLAKLQRYLVFEANDPLFGSDAVTPSELRGRMIEVFPRGVNPELFERTFGHLEAMHVELVPTGFDGRPLRPKSKSGKLVPSFFSTTETPGPPGHRMLAGSDQTGIVLLTRASDERHVLRSLRGIASQVEAPAPSI